MRRFGCMFTLTGYFCPTGSTSPTTASCQPGTYSVAGAAVCSNCSAGRFGQTVALDTPVCSGDCPAGRYCTEGSIVPVRLPFLPKGMHAAFHQGRRVFGLFVVYWCMQKLCPPGKWSNVIGQPSACSLDCPAGYFCPEGTFNSTLNPCGNPVNYCPAGSGSPLLSGVGNYTLGGVSAVTRTSQTPCPAPWDSGMCICVVCVR
jgi:hypothetical protein